MSVIRRAEPGDLPVIAAIAADVLDGAWTAASLGEELARPIARVFVAEGAGAVDGFAITWHVAGEVSLLLIAVARRAQRSGVGTRLLEALEAAARADAQALVLLEVRASNAAARAFYARHGYVETGVRRGYYADRGEDAILMERALT